MKRLTQRTACVTLEGWNRGSDVNYTLIFDVVSAYAETEQPLMPLLVYILQLEPTEKTVVYLIPHVCEIYKLMWLKKRDEYLGFPLPLSAQEAIWNLTQLGELL
jgi:hypothetical protein